MATLTPEQQNAKTKAEAAAFATRLKKTSTVAKNPFSPSAAKLAEAEKVKAAFPAISISIMSSQGNSTVCASEAETLATLQAILQDLQKQVQEANLISGTRLVRTYNISLTVNVK